jgi:hypothetical protein
LNLLVRIPLLTMNCLNVKENVDKLFEIKIEINNPEINFFYFYISLLYNEYNNDVRANFEACDEAEKLCNIISKLPTNNRKFVINLSSEEHSYIKIFNEGIKLLNKDTSFFQVKMFIIGIF